MVVRVRRVPSFAYQEGIEHDVGSEGRWRMNVRHALIGVIKN